MILSIIIPLKIDGDRDHLSLLKQTLEEVKPFSSSIELIISIHDLLENKEKYQNLQTLSEVQFIYTNQKKERPFNLSLARNRGAQKAKGKFLFFKDIDLLSPKKFYKNLLKDIAINEFLSKETRFYTFPVLSLNQIDSEKIIDTRMSKDPLFWINVYHTKPDRLFDHYPVSSALLLHKKNFFAVGQYDEIFEGWGAEDHDLYIRLLLKDTAFKKSAFFFSFLRMRYENMIFNYGWRSQLKRYGEMCFQKNLFLFHIWHKTGYRRVRNSNNIDHMHKKIKQYKKEKIACVYDYPGQKRKSLIFILLKVFFNRLACMIRL
tara:strand:- start:10864 stop:11817 length:954 start_codon:yes stop_codon:yes gene_type:complete